MNLSFWAKLRFLHSELNEEEDDTTRSVTAAR